MWAADALFLCGSWASCSFWKAFVKSPSLTVAVLARWSIRMVPVENYKTMPKFVKVMPKMCRLFPDTMYIANKPPPQSAAALAQWVRCVMDMLLWDWQLHVKRKPKQVTFGDSAGDIQVTLCIEQASLQVGRMMSVSAAYTVHLFRRKQSPSSLRRRYWIAVLLIKVVLHTQQRWPRYSRRGRCAENATVNTTGIRRNVRIWSGLNIRCRRSPTCYKTDISNRVCNNLIMMHTM